MNRSGLRSCYFPIACACLTTLAITLYPHIAQSANSSLGFRHQLRENCGHRFDGVNATYLPGLKRSLKIRRSKKKYPDKTQELQELRCRIRILERKR